MLKYTHWIGVAFAVMLVVSCFMPWAWYPDLNMSFTGFFSYKNYYGKPGKLLTVCAVFAIVFFLIPRIWAKRWNLLFCAITLAYSFYCFITFSKCYGPAICPEKRVGIFCMFFSAVFMMLMALLPNLKLSEKETA